uniref:Activin_recp domain-containing protein n=1 Tax=Parastrongyloides trichosuri TaxID=131310 RepID=A0A0N4ZE24_PARTI
MISFLLLNFIFYIGLINIPYVTSIKLPSSLPILYCTGSETKYCPSHFCYNALSLDNQKYKQGCAKKNECFQTGCSLLDDNTFICCCGTDNCNNLKMSTLKLYFQDYMSYEDNNIEYFSRSIRSKAHFNEQDIKVSDDIKDGKKKTSDIFEDELLLSTKSSSINKNNSDSSLFSNLNEGSGQDINDDNNKLTIVNIIEDQITTVAERKNDDITELTNVDKVISDVVPETNNNISIKEPINEEKNSKIKSNTFAFLMTSPKRSVTTVKQLIKPYPWYYVTAAGFILSVLVVVIVYMVIKRVKRNDNHEELSQSEPDLEFVNVMKPKERSIIREEPEENEKLIDKNEIKN